MWDGVRHCYILLFRFFLFHGGQGVLGGQEWSTAESKTHVYKTPTRRAYPLFCCSYTWPPRKGLDFCICSRTLLCVFQDRERINLSVLLREENLQGEPVSANHASFSRQIFVLPPPPSISKGVNG